MQIWESDWNREIMKQGSGSEGFLELDLGTCKRFLWEQLRSWIVVGKSYVLSQRQIGLTWLCIDIQVNRVEFVDILKHVPPRRATPTLSSATTRRQLAAPPACKHLLVASL
jgi:hypothetical protein